MYRENFAERPGRDGRLRRVIQRTVFASLFAGAIVALATPELRTYDVDSYEGVNIYPYQPAGFDAPFLEPLQRPFSREISVSPSCMVCPSQVVAFQQPVAAYGDPVELIADLQISGGFADGMAAPYAEPAPDPQTAALAAQVSELQQEVSTAVDSNTDLQAQMANQRAQIASMQAQAADAARASLQAKAPPEPVQVPEPVRQQIREEVRDGIAHYQQQQPLTLPEVVEQARQRNYIFQVADMMEAASAATGEPCSLTTGDLLSFAELPDENQPVAKMAVVTSKSGSCRAGTTVDVGLSDLQEMLNAFSQRLESNMTRVHVQIDKPT